MFEYYNNILCVQGGWLYNRPVYDKILALKKMLKTSNDDKEDLLSKLDYLKREYKKDCHTIITKPNYDAMSSRGLLKKLKNGGCGRTALVVYDSLPDRIQKKIVEQYGDPHKTVKNYKFIDYLETDQDALSFYKGHLLSNGEHLPKPNILQYVAEASILNAIKTIVTNTTAKRKALGGGATKLWDKLSTVIQALPQHTYPHSLPSNVRSLKRKYKAYNQNGYTALIHKGFSNTNSEKINDNAKVWIISRWADRVVKVANLQQLLFEYNEMAAIKSWKPLKEEATLRNYLYKEGIKHLWYGHRYGDAAAKEKFSRKHSTKLPTMRDSLWYSDGTKLNYFYRDAKGKIATCQVYEVMDAYSEVFLGYHISKTEDYQAQFAAYKMAVKISEHKPYQIGFDGQGGHKKLKAGNFLTKVARLAIKTAPYNGSSKTIESAFGRFQAQFLKRDWFFTGQNITAKKQESKSNREFINTNLSAFPTLEQVKAIYAKRRQEWNEAPHPKTGIPRLEMYMQSSNPETVKINLWDMVDLFWIERPIAITCTSDGIVFDEKKVTYKYEVYRSDNLPDVEWLRNNIDKKFIVKFDPEDMSMIYLYEKSPLGLKFVTEARTKIEIHRGKQEQEAWENEFIQKVKKLNDEARIKTDDEMDAILADHGMLPEQYGLKSPSLLGVKSKRKKSPNNIGKIQKRESNEVSIKNETEDINLYDLM